MVLEPAGGKPHRFFIDLTPTSRERFMAAVERGRPPMPAAETSSARPEVSGDGKYTVVLDPGHGGIDPGATSPQGIEEKKVVLAVAKVLREKLLAADGRYQVVMTRENDTFLSLAERVEVARRVNADLFVSIHADIIGRGDVRGASVYTLSEKASDKEAAELAAKENKSDVIAGVDLGVQDQAVASILIDLARRETMNFSAEFATLLVPELEKRGLRHSSRAHRFAGFRVLKAPDVPSVLIELGYLSNKQDLAVLTSKNGHQTLARAVKDAVENYFSRFRS
jgi:N-acetylmuramoyl-L-alanine amidase